MKIYTLLQPSTSNEYATFAHLGTWVEVAECSACDTEAGLKEPLLIQWEPGAVYVGNFAWCGYIFAVTQEVKNFLVDQRFDCRYGRVEVMAPDNTYQKTVPWPYQGPELFWVISNQAIPLNVKRSGISVDVDCPICKRIRYNFSLGGIVIDRTDWNGQKIFSIEQFEHCSDAIFVTEVGLSELIDAGFSNFSYQEAGCIQ